MLFRSLNLGIRQKLLMGFLAVVVTVLSISYAAFYFRSQAVLRHEVERSLLATTEIAATHLDHRVAAMENVVAQVASRTLLRRSLQAWNEGERVESLKVLSRIISDARNATPEISNVAIFSSDRRYVAGIRSDFDASRIPPELFDAAATQSGYLGLMNAGTPAQKMIVGGSLDLDGQRLGLVFAFIDLDGFDTFATNANVQAAGLSLVVTTKEGATQKRILPSPGGGDRLGLVFNPFQEAQLGRPVLREGVDNRGVPVLAVLSIQPRLGWGLTAKVDREIVLAPLRDQTNFLLFLAAACLLLAVVITLLISGVMTRPILDMTHVTALIASGDVHRRIEHLSQDELGLLARAVNQMADKLLTLKAELELRVSSQEQHLLQLSADLTSANNELTRLSTSDPLTGIANRRVFDAALTREWGRCRRQQSTLAVLVFDVDHFKALNDSLGHSAGDAALQRVAKVLQHGVQRSCDTVARIGGEEFAALLPDTSLTDALRVAETLRIAVMADAIAHPASGTSPVVTVSVGVAARVPEDGEATQLLREADKALYQAKAGGRNRVES